MTAGVSAAAKAALLAGELGIEQVVWKELW